MRVLYIEHGGLVSGAQHALLDLLAALPDDVEPVAACPPGPMSDALRVQGVPVLPLRGTEGSLKLHPLHTPRAVGELGAMAVAVRGLAHRTGAALVHANSPRAGLAAVGARSLGGPPAVVHVRDVLPPGRAAEAVQATLHRAEAAIAVSGHAARAFGGERTVTIHDSVDLERFDAARVDRAAARERFGLGADALALGVVAQITQWKGQDTAIRVLARVAHRHPGAVLLLAGEPKFVSSATRFDNVTFHRRLHQLADELGVGGRVRFLGERDDVPELMRALDVLLVPSWDEPFGLVVVEAMAMRTPVLATTIGGPAEILSDGIDGFLADPLDVDAWVGSADWLLADRAQRERMGARGAANAARFGRAAHAAAVRDVYERVLSGRPRRA